MLNVIYSEFLKLKKSYIILLVLIGGSVNPGFMDLAIMVSGEKNRTFEKYVYNIELINFSLIYGILFALIAGYIFCREYSDKTASTLYAYPISRVKIFIGKLIIIYALITIVYFIQMVTMYLGYYMLYGSIEYKLIINDIKVNICSLLFQFLLIPIPIFIANISKNIVLTVSYGILSFIITASLTRMKSFYIKYIPLLTPYFCAKNFYYPGKVDMMAAITSGIICFVISIALCIYQYNKTDMTY
ncbi:ABC transporter permease [Clostridium weizhouense]|uniref:ABC transporter permease n=1 Tax=Clostridium weizhouense TaxID=2859781 RepID=A0ABS7APZ7_9CLOT|nr:ABC transporter permease [Clostridium weizhouense]MBW6410739.1 ABC transporter permease [Clostridium weizhouense]